MKSPCCVLFAFEFVLIFTKLSMFVMPFEAIPTLFFLIPYSANNNMANA
jgi:hypothetical protein